MRHQDLDLFDALELAKAAERQAADLYQEAAETTDNPLARDLFVELAEFEQHHYDTLTELEASLRYEGAFLGYESRQLTVERPAELEPIQDPDRKSAMAVITMAIDIEEIAERRYTSLADQTSDPDGRSMFRRLAEEEHSHYLVLSDAYWRLTNRGVWTAPY